MHFITARATEADEAEACEYAESQYRAVLRRMDWRYEFSDDASVVREAREMLEWLREQHHAVDPDLSIWHSIAPEGFGIPTP